MPKGELTVVSSTSAPSTTNKEDGNRLTVTRKQRTRSKTPDKKLIDWEKVSPRPNAEDCIFNAVPPNIHSLKEVHRKNYQRRLLDKMLDNSIIIEDHVLLEDESGRKVKIFLSDLLQQKLNDGDERNKAMLIIRKFLFGITDVLKFDQLERGKKLIQEAANEKLPHAMYTSAIITFAEVVQYCYSNKKDSDSKKSKLPGRKELKDAVRNMIDVKRRFFPLPNFVLGMIQHYKIDCLAKLIEPTNSTIWREYFEDVLITGMSEEESETFDVWYNIWDDGYRKLDKKLLNKQANMKRFQKYRDVLKDEDGQFLKWMVQAIKFELAIEGLERKHHIRAKSLLEELSSEGFVESNYVQAFSLLNNEFRDNQAFDSHNLNEAFNLLNTAVTREHQEAMLLFGILPFIKEFDHIENDTKAKSWTCIDSLIKYVMSGNEEFRKEAAKLVAAEYLKRDLLPYNEERAKFLLRTSGCFEELRELEKNLRARKNAATDALPDVLIALEEINCKFEKCAYALKLLPDLHLLVDALKNREIEIHKSRKVLLQLELINIECADMDESTMERRLLNSIQLMYDVLRTRVVSQSSCSKVGSLLHCLLKTCVTIQMERIDLY